MKLLECGMLSLLLGCVPDLPREPYLWRDDAPPIGVHRADVARAEGRVIEYLTARGTLEPEEMGCGASAKAYEVFTVETPSAFEVRLTLRPGLCDQAPEDTNLPPLPLGIYEGPMSFAVRKSDFRIIRFRFPSDPFVPMVFKPKPAPSPKNALAFTTPSLHVAVGACSGPVGVETRDPSGNHVGVAEAVTVNMAATPPSTVFFSDATCSTAITSVGVDAGKSGAEVYFRATQVGPLQITASAAALSGASQTNTVESAQPVTLTFVTPPRSASVDRCSEAVTVQTRDAFDNPANVRAETFVEFLANPAKGIKLYARADCTGPVVTRAPIAASSNSTSVYFKAKSPGTVALNVVLGMSTASQDAIITSSAPLPPKVPGP